MSRINPPTAYRVFFGITVRDFDSQRDEMVLWGKLFPDRRLDKERLFDEFYDELIDGIHHPDGFIVSTDLDTRVIISTSTDMIDLRQVSVDNGIYDTSVVSVDIPLAENIQKYSAFAVKYMLPSPQFHVLVGYRE